MIFRLFSVLILVNNCTFQFPKQDPGIGDGLHPRLDIPTIDGGRLNGFIVANHWLEKHWNRHGKKYKLPNYDVSFFENGRYLFEAKGEKGPGWEGIGTERGTSAVVHVDMKTLKVRSAREPGPNGQVVFGKYEE